MIKVKGPMVNVRTSFSSSKDFFEYVQQKGFSFTLNGSEFPPDNDGHIWTGVLQESTMRIIENYNTIVTIER